MEKSSGGQSTVSAAPSSPSVSAVAGQLPGKDRMSGFLWKRGENNKRYQERFFVLSSDGTMEYYKTKTSKSKISFISCMAALPRPAPTSMPPPFETAQSSASLSSSSSSSSLADRVSDASSHPGERGLDRRGDPGFSFEIVTADRTYCMVANTNVERDLWLQKLREVSVPYQQNLLLDSLEQQICAAEQKTIHRPG